ncbi:sporulation initiation factor Spo0A C-terminal domain-containing protein [Gemmiger sp. An194]|uniref:sporulation initiation factor Spo0A C-terminal domain-containing protein n=1 Tax=Gemmiger sp. An194 TaxID=1965582 RepID=UPI000B3A5500|nr:sporulation initiation factor Spo0A C-terminal domain-containing protein [Gemmiger sp. An194]OUP23299.1 hypothetical protein B5F28_12395 [Gemmiger sp. An194]
MTQERIFEELNRIGVPTNVQGRYYIETALDWILRQPGHRYAITKELYPMVAKIYGVTANNVERAIRHAIANAFTRGNVEYLNRYFGYTVDSRKDKPTNSEFLTMVARRLQMKGENQHDPDQQS